MSRSTLAILITAVGFSALAGSAQAQISGTIGGDIVANQGTGDRWIAKASSNAYRNQHDDSLTVLG